jgi:lysophospholipase L1-like esterase
MIVVYSGDNDIANGKEPDAIVETAETFVDGLRRLANGALVVVLSAKPSIARWELKDKYIELNALLKEMLANFDYAVFVDVWTPMLNRKGELNKELFEEDGLHMNEKGYEVWKNALKPFLSR